MLAGTESAPGSPGEQLIDLVREAFASGLAWSFRLVAVLALAGLVVSVLFVGGTRRAAGCTGPTRVIFSRTRAHTPNRACPGCCR